MISSVYPAHGAGSACGKNMQKETVDTLGNQKRTNYALNQKDKQSFYTRSNRRAFAAASLFRDECDDE
jgi:hypothetical protein